ncbi:MAG: hypothetical protein N2746_02765 [Deltaproteobacteria bacterium]|nr:hypothetical protein [Deltaproteobacteria bacterium]
MFFELFYRLYEMNVPVTPTSFLRLNKAIYMGLINSVDDLYYAARSILIKSERYFDIYDKIFVNIFSGVEFKNPDEEEIDEILRMMLSEWLKDPKELAILLGLREDSIRQLSPDDLIKYFLERLKEQSGEHHGGNRWIGTGGISPVGHSGNHPGGMRIKGYSLNKSAVKLALERRYKDYSNSTRLSRSNITESLKKLRDMKAEGPRDILNIRETINNTVRNGGEIEFVFDRSLKDRLKVILAVDNGGWSMDPYVDIVQTIFDYAKYQFKELKTYYFHNTIYGFLWEDPPRRSRPVPIESFGRFDRETRLIIIGDASMAYHELMAYNGSIYYYERSGIPSIVRLKYLRNLFPYSVWLNPVSSEEWDYVQTIKIIREIFPMFETTLVGLEEAVKVLKHG